MTTDLNPRLQELIDKQDIYELLVRYMRGLDRLDKDLLLSVYHDDATDDRGFFNGSAKDFVDVAISLLSEHKSNHHMIGQADIQVEGDVAFGEIYFQAYHRIVQNGLEKDFLVVGRYVDRYEKRNGVWKIAFRSELNDFDRTDPATDDWSRATPEALRGARGAEDLSSQREKLRTR